VTHDTPPPAGKTATPGPVGRQQLQALSLLAEDLYDGLDRLREQYGPSFRVGMGRAQVLWLSSPSSAEALLARPPADLTMRKAYSFLEPVGGRGALIATDGVPHGTRRSDLTRRFYGSDGSMWIESLRERFPAWLDQHAQLQVVPSFLDAVRPLLLDVVLDTMVGRSSLAEDRTWKQQVMALMEHSTRSLTEQFIRVPLPGSSWASFLATRREVDRALNAAIDERLAQGTPDDGTFDVLDLVVSMAEKGRYPAGGARRAIRDEIMGLISAGFETTASASTWALAYTQSEPVWGSELKRRLQDLSAKEVLTDPWVDAFLNEVLRLRPPAPVMLRRATRRTQIDGHTVPKGSLVAFTVWLLHRDGDLHADAATFNPERFLDTKPERWSFLPFGYGERYCIGGPMARTLIKGLLHQLYQQADVSRMPVSMKPTGLSLRPTARFEVTLNQK